MKYENSGSHLIILDGLSTAGKTTTAKAFMELNPKSILLQRSDHQRKLLLRELPLFLKKDNNLGPLLFCYVTYRNCPSFKKHFFHSSSFSSNYLEEVASFIQETKDTILITEEKETAREASTHLSQGLTVLLDNLIFKDNLSSFDNLFPYIVLIYCPFKHLLEHIKKRNDEAIKYNKPLKWRNPYKVYAAYSRLFGPINILNYKESVEVLSRKTLLETLEVLFQDFPPEEFAIDKEIFRSNVLESLFTTSVHEVEIFPQLTSPNFVIDTRYDVEDNALALRQHLYQTSPYS